MAASDRRRARAMLAIAASIGVTVLAACNGILGIDKFYDSTDGGPSSDANGSDVITGVDGSVDSSTEDVTDAGIDVPVITLPEGSAPVSFARWKMPDRVASSPNPPSYAIADGGVKDNVTGLAWMQTDLPVVSGEFADAHAACANAPNGPWRVPTRIELISLLDYVDGTGAPKTPPFIDSTFTGTQLAPYWTASPVLPPRGSPLTEPIYFWLVDFSDGTLPTTKAKASNRVRCVRGGS